MRKFLPKVTLLYVAGSIRYVSERLGVARNKSARVRVDEVSERLVLYKAIETTVPVDEISVATRVPVEVSERLSVAQRLRIEPKAFTELGFVFVC